MQSSQTCIEGLITQAMVASALQQNNNDQSTREESPPRNRESDYPVSPTHRLHTQVSLPHNLDAARHPPKPKQPAMRMSIAPLPFPTTVHQQQKNRPSDASVLPVGGRRSSFGRPRFSSAHVPGKSQLAENILAEAQASDSDDDDDDERDSHESGTHEDVDGLSWETTRKKPWYKKKRITRFVLLLISAIFFLAGGLYLAYSDDEIDGIEVWRLLFFIGGLPLIWLIGDITTRIIVWGVEHTMFTVQNALYFAYAVRRPLANVLRASLALGWWALMVTAWDSSLSQDVQDAYDIVLKIWACITLFMLANLLKTLFAKILALKFNKQSHLRKIQDSLRKEYLLHLLLQPRLRYSQEEDMVGPDDSAARLGAGSTTSSAQQEPEDGSYNAVHIKKEGSGGRMRGDGGERHWSSSVRGWFGSRKENHLKPSDITTATSAEELLEEGAAPSSNITTSCHPDNSLVNIQVDCVQGERRSSSPTRRSNAHGGAATTTTAGLQRSGISNVSMTSGSWPPQQLYPSPRGRSSTQNTAGSNARHQQQQQHGGLLFGTGLSRDNSKRQSRFHQDGVGLNRMASQVTVPYSTKAAARLSVVMEDPIKKGKAKKVLDMQQLAKMEKYIRKNALKATFKDELSRVETDEENSSELEARKLAYYIFWNVKADLSREYLVKDDFRDFMAEEEVEPAFSIIDENKDGTVTLQECMATMTKLFKERRDLSVSLKDTKSVVKKLESVIGVCIHIVFFFIYMRVFDMDVMKTYLALSSLILAFSFVFNNSIRTTYENVVFLFVVHPFDIGDLIQIENEIYRVDQIDLLYTIMIQGSGGRMWYPNQKLMSAPFTNVSVSQDKGDLIKLIIDMDVASIAMDAAQIAAEEVAASVPTEIVADSVGVSVRDAAAPLKYTLNVGWKYTHCGVEMGRCATVRTRMHLALAEALMKAGVRYTWPKQFSGEFMSVSGGSGADARVSNGATGAPAPPAATTTGATKKDA